VLRFCVAPKGNLELFCSVYIDQTRPHCFRMDWHATAFACLLTRCNAGSNNAMSNTITAITTKSSINVNPLGLLIPIRFLFRLNMRCTNTALCSVNFARRRYFSVIFEYSKSSVCLKVPHVQLQSIFRLAGRVKKFAGILLQGVSALCILHLPAIIDYQTDSHRL
jgi:hypothetical protein